MAVSMAFPYGFKGFAHRCIKDKGDSPELILSAAFGNFVNCHASDYIIE